MMATLTFRDGFNAWLVQAINLREPWREIREILKTESQVGNRVFGLLVGDGKRWLLL